MTALKDYPTMPYPEGGNPASCLENSLILSELNYNNDEARLEFENLFLSMTETVAMCKQLCFGGSVLGLFMKAILIVTIQKQIPRVGGLGAS
ncbi:hypothetical protein JHK85_010008 [Glycine max]|nr:hypothetical protein JHK85_010008 [Glycine max]